MIRGQTASVLFSSTIAGLFVSVSANAQMSNMGVEAGMYVSNVKHATTGVLLVPDVGAHQSDPTAASVDLTQSTTGIHVYSSMAFSSVTADSAVLDFSIGMNGNGWPGNAFGPSMGGLGGNGGHLLYTNATSTTWTIGYDLNVSGSDTFGMQSIDIYLGPFTVHLGGTTPAPGHYSGTQAFNVGAGTWHVDTYFSPNVSGGSSFGSIDGQYDGSITFNFGPVAAPVPEPETYAMLLAGLGLLGFAARRRKQKEATLA